MCFFVDGIPIYPLGLCSQSNKKCLTIVAGYEILKKLKIFKCTLYVARVQSFNRNHKTYIDAYFHCVIVCQCFVTRCPTFINGCGTPYCNVSYCMNVRHPNFSMPGIHLILFVPVIAATLRISGIRNSISTTKN